MSTLCPTFPRSSCSALLTLIAFDYKYTSALDGRGSARESRCNPCDALFGVLAARRGRAGPSGYIQGPRCIVEGIRVVFPPLPPAAAVTVLEKIM